MRDALEAIAHDPIGCNGPHIELEEALRVLAARSEPESWVPPTPADLDALLIQWWPLQRDEYVAYIAARSEPPPVNATPDPQWPALAARSEPGAEGLRVAAEAVCRSWFDRVETDVDPSMRQALLELRNALAARSEPSPVNTTPDPQWPALAETEPDAYLDATADRLSSERIDKAIAETEPKS